MQGVALHCVTSDISVGVVDRPLGEILQRYHNQFAISEVSWFLFNYYVGGTTI